MITSSVSRRGQSIVHPLIRSTWIVVRLAYSTAVPHTSPSPWQACASPMNRRAPGVRTGRYVMLPGPMSGRSMLPPWLSGVSELIESSSGDVLSVPMCGRYGSVTRSLQ